jgi:hypothetical protein
MESKRPPPPPAGAFSAGLSPSRRAQTADERGGDQDSPLWPSYGQFPAQAAPQMGGMFNMANAHNSAAPPRLELRDLSGGVRTPSHGRGLAPPPPAGPAAASTPVSLPWGGTVGGFPGQSVHTTTQSPRRSVTGGSGSTIPSFSHANAPARARQSPFTPTSATTPKDAWHPTAHAGRYNVSLHVVVVLVRAVNAH